MEISAFFEPVDLMDFKFADETEGHLRMGDIIDSYLHTDHFPDYSKADVVIFGVREERNAINNEGCSEAPDFIRRYLYALFPGAYKLNIADLGNIKPGYTISDTYYAVTSVVSEMLTNNIV